MSFRLRVPRYYRHLQCCARGARTIFLKYCELEKVIFLAALWILQVQVTNVTAMSLECQHHIWFDFDKCSGFVFLHDLLPSFALQLRNFNTRVVSFRNLFTGSLLHTWVAIVIEYLHPSLPHIVRWRLRLVEANLNERAHYCVAVVDS